VFTELVLPSLFHPNPDCRLNAIENIVILYKLVGIFYIFKLGDDIKIIINDLQNLKPNLKDTIIARMDEIDIVVKKDLNSQIPNDPNASRINGKSESRNKSNKDDPSEEAKLIESLKKTPKSKKGDLKGSIEKINRKDNLINTNKSNGMINVKKSESKKVDNSMSPEGNNLRKSKVGSK
jgi:hypothetical protein